MQNNLWQVHKDVVVTVRGVGVWEESRCNRGEVKSGFNENQKQNERQHKAKVKTRGTNWTRHK